MAKGLSKKTLTVIIIAMILAILGCAVLTLSSKPHSGKPLFSEKNFQNKVSYIINYGEGNINEYQIDISENSTVFSLLEELAERENFEIETIFYSEAGVFIKSIGEAEGGTNNTWWQYWINGKLGEMAADKKEIKAGDIIEWKFEASLF